MTTINDLQKTTGLLDSDYFLVKSGAFDYKATAQQLDSYFNSKNINRFAPVKSNSGSWVMNNGIWVSGYNKTETDNLLSKKFDYELKDVNTNPTTLPDGAYKWTWNSGNPAMPFNNNGEYACACIVLNGTRRLVLRRSSSSRVFEYQSVSWREIGAEVETIIKELPQTSSGIIYTYVSGNAFNDGVKLMTLTAVFPSTSLGKTLKIQSYVAAPMSQGQTLAETTITAVSQSITFIAPPYGINNYSQYLQGVIDGSTNGVAFSNIRYLTM